MVHDLFVTDTALFADYVLPATRQIEHRDRRGLQLISGKTLHFLNSWYGHMERHRRRTGDFFIASVNLLTAEEPTDWGDGSGLYDVEVAADTGASVLAAPTVPTAATS